MRLITAASATFVLALGLGISLSAGPDQTEQPAAANPQSANGRGNGHHDGRDIFRFDTFGDEQLWTDVLRMHEVLPNVDPKTALAVGLKVDADALPPAVIKGIQASTIDLTNPAITIELLRLNAVVGVQGTVDEEGHLTKVGITCALCHSSVDNSVVPGVGRRLDGWANTDLDVGKIVALSPAPELDEETKNEFRMWGPGKYDPRHHVAGNLPAEFRDLRTEKRQQDIAGDAHCCEQCDIDHRNRERTRDDPSSPSPGDWSAQELHEWGDEIGKQQRQQEKQNHALQREEQPESSRDREKQQDQPQNGGRRRHRRRSSGVVVTDARGITRLSHCWTLDRDLARSITLLGYSFHHRR